VAPIQAIVRPLEGAQTTLQALQAQGLKLGLFSNTVWPGAFHLEDLARWGLDVYLECAFFSADVGAWKPAPEVFEMTLRALGLQPEEAVYVGDHPLFDIYGAQRAGLRGVWIYGKEWEDYQSIDETVPDATVRRLPDLIDVLATWSDC
jgi:putative hydrolase of the HAD superfamily